VGQGSEHARKEHHQNEAERAVVTQDEQLAGAIDLPQRNGVRPLEPACDKTTRKYEMTN
jgi:hypothetical protein